MSSVSNDESDVVLSSEIYASFDVLLSLCRNDIFRLISKCADVVLLTLLGVASVVGGKCPTDGMRLVHPIITVSYQYFVPRESDSHPVIASKVLDGFRAFGRVVGVLTIKGLVTNSS